VVVGTAVMVITAVAAAIPMAAVTAGKDIQRPVRMAPWAIISAAVFTSHLART
jgi:hypothetical protein